MWNILYSLIILSSITIIPMSSLGDIFWIPKEAIFFLGGFILIASSLITNKEKTLSFKNKWLGFILIYTILTFIWFFYLPLIFNNAQGKILWNLWNIRPTLNLILGLLLIKTLVEYTDNLNRWVGIAKLLCWILFGFSIYAIMQFFRIEPILFSDNIRWGAEGIVPITFLGNTNLTGNFLAILSPLCLIFKGLRYKLFYIFCFIAILMTKSSLSLLAFFIGLEMYFLLTKKWKWSLVIFLLFLSGALFLQTQLGFFSFSGRLGIWKDTFLVCKNRIIFGNGLGNFAFKKINILGTNALSTHSEPLQIMFDGGLTMIILIIGYILSLFRKFILSENTMLKIGYISGFISFLFISLGSFPLRIAPLALVGLLYIASLEAQT